MIDHFARLLGLAAVDSVNLLAFAVIAGLWLTSGGERARFLPQAARFTGGAFVGIVSLLAVSVWLAHSHQDLVRDLLSSIPVMAVLAAVGAALVVVGLRQLARTVEEEVEAPLARTGLQRFGFATTGVVLGIVQSATSVPFAAGVVVVAFSDSSTWSRVVQVLVFALVAIAPSAALIAALARVRSGRMTAAAGTVDRFLRRGRALGRYLTIVVGIALVVFAVVRILQLTGDH